MSLSLEFRKKEKIILNKYSPFSLPFNEISLLDSGWGAVVALVRLRL